MAVMVKCSSVTLSNIIQRNFPEEYAERRSEHETMTYAGVDLMPLFVMDVVLPCQKMALNIFEPRYRLMVRRIMEGNHRMGMVRNLCQTIALFILKELFHSLLA